MKNLRISPIKLHNSPTISATPINNLYVLHSSFCWIPAVMASSSCSLIIAFFRRFLYSFISFKTPALHLKLIIMIIPITFPGHFPSPKSYNSPRINHVILETISSSLLEKFPATLWMVLLADFPLLQYLYIDSRLGIWTVVRC